MTELATIRADGPAAEPLVSIILPTHNRAEYLSQSVESCLAQTYRRWELIIVDDASTDSTPELAARYARQDERVRCIRHAVNRKLPAALNTGFAQTRGGLLTWTSDDNAYRPDALAEMVRFMQGHPDVGLVYAGFTRIDEAGRPTGQALPMRPEEIVCVNVVGACFMYRRAVLERLGGYDEGAFCAEDYDYWLRASVHFRLAPLEKDLYLYRHHGQSLSATRRQRVREAAEMVLARALPQMRWLGGPRRCAGWLRLAGWALECDDRPAARRYMLRALRSAPRHVLGNYKEPLITALLGPGWASLLRGPYLHLKRLVAGCGGRA